MKIIVDYFFLLYQALLEYLKKDLVSEWNVLRNHKYFKDVPHLVKIEEGPKPWPQNLIQKFTEIVEGRVILSRGMKGDLSLEFNAKKNSVLQEEYSFLV